MKKITGIMVYYYFICHKRLWYFAKGLNMEQESELVEIGKLIDEYSYSREKKHLMIDEKINIDFTRGWDIIHEVKKSDKLEEASIWQIKYYISVLEEQGLNIKKGVLDYPKLKKKTEVYFSEEDRVKIKEILLNIETIINREIPPKEKKVGYCKACSYFELCYI